jgi:hypothetical protein
LSDTGEEKTITSPATVNINNQDTCWYTDNEDGTPCTCNQDSISNPGTSACNSFDNYGNPCEYCTNCEYTDTDTGEIIPYTCGPGDKTNSFMFSISPTDADIFDNGEVEFKLNCVLGDGGFINSNTGEPYTNNDCHEDITWVILYYIDQNNDSHIIFNSCTTPGSLSTVKFPKCCGGSGDPCPTPTPGGTSPMPTPTPS